MEAEFLSLGLDIIGLGVFNYQFGSITSESPVIKVRVVGWGAMVALMRTRTQPVTEPELNFV
jgi:hypothetical protein